MTADLSFLDCDQWTKQQWQQMYANYCQHNAHGEMTKREYFEFVHTNQKRIKNAHKGLSDDLLVKWSRGKQNARLWAKKHGCDMNGRLLIYAQNETSLERLAEKADRTEDIALTTGQKLDYIINRIRQK